jgi:hypothetical protein
MHEADSQRIAKRVAEIEQGYFSAYLAQMIASGLEAAREAFRQSKVREAGIALARIKSAGAGSRDPDVIALETEIMELSAPPVPIYSRSGLSGAYKKHCVDRNLEALLSGAGINPGAYRKWRRETQYKNGSKVDRKCVKLLTKSLLRAGIDITPFEVR